MDYEKLRIADYKHWSVVLHHKPYYLGRVCLWANRADAMDLMETTPEEQKEFFEVGSDVTVALYDLFLPDMMNYSAQGTVTKHLHVQFVPRYKEKHVFNGITFKDDNWGKSFTPYDEDFSVPEKTMLAIRDAIRERLEAVREQERSL
jgi:diadenosine tetraphosphate (Ap4A) HIT family hydrolase